MKISLRITDLPQGSRPNEDGHIAFETPRDSLVLACNGVMQKLDNDDKTVWSDLNKLIAKANENIAQATYLQTYIEHLKQIIIDNTLKNAMGGSKGAISLEQKEEIFEIVRNIVNSTLEHQIVSISNSFCSDKTKGSALDSLTLTPESTVSKFFETTASLMSSVNSKDKKRANTSLDEFGIIVTQICLMYATSHPTLTGEFTKVKTLFITNVRTALEHESVKNTLKLKESRELLEKILKTLITTLDDSSVPKNDTVKLDDFPTVKFNTDQLKERVIRIESQDLARGYLDSNGNKIPEDSVEFWKAQLFASQTKYNTLKLYVDDMIFGLGFS
jgi:hypothetical protein